MAKKKKGKGKKKVKQLAFTPLLPFKGLMKKQLAKRKISHNNKIEDIATKFFNAVVKGKSTFEYDEETKSLDPVTITAIVTGILSFIKGLKDKKEAGKDLGKGEKDILEAAEKVEANIKQMAEKEVNAGIGGTIQKYWWILPVALVGVYFLAKKK